MSKTVLLLLPLSLTLAACTPQAPAPTAETTPTPTPTPTPAPTPAQQPATPVDTPASATAATPAPATAVASPAASTPAAASSPAAREAVVAALRKFTALKRYRANMTVVERADAKPVTHELDFVAPDRYRIDESRIVIGDTLYTTAKGRSSKSTLPADTLAPWQALPGLAAASLAAGANGLTAEGGRGMMVIGQPSKQYTVRLTKPVPAEYTLWIGPTGLPIKIETATGTGGKASIRYSHYDDPALKIEAPKP